MKKQPQVKVQPQKKKELSPAEIQELSDMKMAQALQAEINGEEPPKERVVKDPMNFKTYFKEFVPYERKIAEGQEGHTYEIEITKGVFTEETFKVFIKYEEHIHKKFEKSKEGYERFLCQSPLYDPADPSEVALPKFGKKHDAHRDGKEIQNSFPQYNGSYHMIHRIDGEVAMVGVLDYTTSCLSSVYLYYDPKWEFLTPGKLAALREIEHIQMSPRKEIHNYYMGLYYQDCPKSVYKAEYKPSQVACPHNWLFVELTEEVKEKIKSERKPKLAEVMNPEFPEMEWKVAFEKGMRSQLEMQSGQKLGIMDLNKGGQELLAKTLPKLFQHLGLDIVQNSELILNM